MANPQSGIEVLNKIWPMLEDIAVMDKEPKLEGRYVNMMALQKLTTLLKSKKSSPLLFFQTKYKFKLIIRFF